VNPNLYVILIVTAGILLLSGALYLFVELVSRRVDDHPRTPRPRNAPKGQRPKGHPGRDRQFGPVETSDFWMPRLGSYGATGICAGATCVPDPGVYHTTDHWQSIPRNNQTEWKCEYCGVWNKNKTEECRNCGAVCTESERIEKVRKIHIMSPDKPLT
jgi:disulfide oxidoreductase YuzD